MTKTASQASKTESQNRIQCLLQLGLECVQELKAYRKLSRLERRGMSEAFFRSAVESGVESLPIVLLATAFTGIVVTHEVAWHMNLALHTIQIIPGFTSQFIVRELAITVPAILLVAKVGASITAELSNMKISAQLDALRLLGISRITTLVLPRVLGSWLATVTLVLIAQAVTLFFSLLIAVTNYGFNIAEFLELIPKFIGPLDLVCALIKASLFGIIIPLIACEAAFRCEGGAEAVGRTTSEAVVRALVSVIIIDFLVNALFRSIL